MIGACPAVPAYDVAVIILTVLLLIGAPIALAFVKDPDNAIRQDDEDPGAEEDGRPDDDDVRLPA